MGKLGSGHVLITEDDPEVSLLLSDLLQESGFETTSAESLQGARHFLSHSSADLILLDLNLVDGSGVDLIPEMVSHPSAPAVLVLTANTSPGTASECINRGAFDYITKPFDVETLLNRIQHALRVRSNEIDQQARSRSSLMELSQKTVPLPSPQMREIEELVVRLGREGSVPVLIRGETGVGKEHIARKIHELSPRYDGPYVAVNCASFEKHLIQSELFAHEKGAYTGAHERRQGLFELTQNGTLFLDEVGELPLDVQGHFLRVLEYSMLRRLGGVNEISVNTRVIAATNTSLKNAVAAGTFRSDLYYRLAVAEIVIPPLRQRYEDIPVLAGHFCREIGLRRGRKLELQSGAIAVLNRYPWPGNVRELRNVIERADLLSPSGTINDGVIAQVLSVPGSSQPAPEPSPTSSLEEVEEAHIRSVLDRCGGNQTRAAEILKISARTLSRRLAKMKGKGATGP